MCAVFPLLLAAGSVPALRTPDPNAPIRCIKGTIVAKGTAQLARVERIKIETDADFALHHAALTAYEHVGDFVSHGSARSSRGARGSPPPERPSALEECDMISAMKRSSAPIANIIRQDLAIVDEWTYFGTRRRDCASAAHDARKALLTQAWLREYQLAVLSGLNEDVSDAEQLEVRVFAGLEDEGVSGADTWSNDQARLKVQQYAPAFRKLSYRCEAAFLNMANPGARIPEVVKPQKVLRTPH